MVPLTGQRIYKQSQTFFTITCHIPDPTVCVSHFACFSMFLAMFQDLHCEILITLKCQFSRHIPGPTVCVFHFPSFFSFLLIFQVLEYTVLIFQVFQSFSPYSRSYQVIFSFSLLVRLLAKFQVLQCAFLIFQIFTVYCHIPDPTVCMSHFPRLEFSHHNPGPTI